MYRHSGQVKREPEEGETVTVEKLVWAIHTLKAGFPLKACGNDVN